MKTRAKGAQVTKAKAPDPGAYGADDITPEDRKRAKDAKAQAADGTNPPSWVSDEETWSKAKEAADKSYDEGDDAYWPAVVHIYGNMGGEIQGKTQKAGGDVEGGTWITMDGGRPLFIADGETAGQALARQSGGATGDAKGGKTGERQRATVGKLKDSANKIASKIKGSSTESAKQLFSAGRHMESARENMASGKYADADNDLKAASESVSSAGQSLSDDDADVGEDLNSMGDKIGSMRDDIRASLSGSRTQKAEHHHADMADVVEMMGEYGMSEADMVEMSGLDADRVKALMHEGAKPTAEELAAMTDACAECEKAAKTEKASKPSYAVASESLLKAELGMSDGEFRRLLSQAVYARWGKQAAVDDIFGDCDVAVVKVWDGDVWASGHRLLRVPFDREGGAVTLGEVNGEVHQTYEPVAKSAPDVDPDSSSCEVEYVAERDKRGEYVIGGLNGEAVTLAKSLSEAGVQARVEDGTDGAYRVVFASRGATCKQLAVRATVDGEFESEPKSFVPYLRNEVLIQKAEEKGIVYAVVYEPDVVDKQGEWATADDIEEAAHEYLRKSRRMKRQHDEHSDSEVVESYIAQADFFLGNRMVRKGSWVIAEKLGEKSKKLYKEGKLTGVSMGGHASYAA